MLLYRGIAHMTRQEAFLILGLGSDATPVQIRNRWWKLAMQYQPDKNPGDKFAEEKFKQIWRMV